MINEKDIAASIASELSLPKDKVANVLSLLADKCTIPFICRYRKEMTGGMDETTVESIIKLQNQIIAVDDRRNAILKSIEEQGKLTSDLKASLEKASSLSELEDIYLPYKPKKRTKAEKARLLGLEGLAKMIMSQNSRSDSEEMADNYCHKNHIDISTEEAVQGALDIITEWISEDQRTRSRIRSSYRRNGIVQSEVVKKKEEEAGQYHTYFAHSEPLSRCPSHRLLAMRRGEKEGMLKVSLKCDDDWCIDNISESSSLVKTAVKSAYKDYARPAIETEFADSSKIKADEEAIDVFAKNVKQVLLASPLGEVAVLAIDPGFRTGCKVVCLDSQGKLLTHTVLYLSRSGAELPKEQEKLVALLKKYKCGAIAIGDGTASRETHEAVDKALEDSRLTDIEVYIVNESGASIYSASEVAREEFPDYDITVRGAVSIGRRLQDPLAELVKIDPKSIGVGQYQHDVDQKLLKEALDRVVESAVNHVGVNLNTASKHLLTYVSGVGPKLAENIIAYRDENGAFTSREELKKVPKLGAKSFEQCAGFLRIRGQKNPLDNTAVHPESYSVVKKMAKDYKVTVEELIANKQVRESIDLNKYVDAKVGLPTLQDIMKELDKPGRDVREKIKPLAFRQNVKEVADLEIGMRMEGIVTNITNFGAFVNIGVHRDGLVHVSEFTRDRNVDLQTIVSVGQRLSVIVKDVDMKLNRVALALDK
ncbi:MAG: Tex family protein [Bacteroidales bacterium]|nr:Tex family protein [Bacteroidales bacterium]